MSLVQIVQKEGYQILILNRGKANPINTELVNVIRKIINKAQNDPDIRGLIFTGNTPGYFSVGLDLKELYYYGEEEIIEFWNSWDAMIMEMARFPKPVIAAINGYSPAGGCVLALLCDYRVMADDEKFLIGLNETAVGIAVPEYIFLLYQFWIGKNRAYQFLMDGKLHTPTEALSCQLINESCSLDEVLLKAEGKMKTWLKKSDNILYNSKQNMRAQLIRELENTPDFPIKQKLKSWFDPKSREVMKFIVESLSK